jgi:hypothetical protein
VLVGVIVIKLGLVVSVPLFFVKLLCGLLLGTGPTSCFCSVVELRLDVIALDG